MHLAIFWKTTANVANY